MFNPHLDIGQCVNNEDIRRIFKCGNMGGIRRPPRRAIVVAKNLSRLFIPKEEKLDAVAEVFSEIGIKEL